MVGSWRRGLTSTWLALCVLLASGGASAGQTLTSGGVAGAVRDGSGRPLEQVSVTLTDPGTGVSRGLVTGPDGQFEFRELVPGEYSLLAERLQYRPHRVARIVVRAASRTRITVSLAAAAPPVGQADVEESGGSALAAAGTSEWFGPDVLRAYPDLRRELSRVGRLSSVSAADVEMEGLPAWMAGVVVDGHAIDALRHPALTGDITRTAAFPLSSVESAELVTGPVDVEWPGSVGGVLSATTRRGTGDVRVRGFGAWSGGPLGVSSPAAQELGSAADVQGGAVLSGPFAGDSAHYLIGFEGRRVERPLGAAWAGAAATALRSAARSVYDVALDPYFARRTATSQALATFGRVDWPVSPRHTVELRGAFAYLPTSDAGAAMGRTRAQGPVTTFDGNDASIGATLRSALGERTNSELRVGVDRSSRSYTTGSDGDSAGAGLPFVRVVSDALTFGSDPVLPGDFAQTSVQASGLLLHAAGRHQLKAGVEGAVSSYDQTYLAGGRGEVFFGDVAALTRRAGVFRQVTGAVPTASFSVPRVSVLVQDRWLPSPGLVLTLGVRAEREALPRDVVENERWKGLTGLSNATITSGAVRLSPRAGLAWDLDGAGRWVLEAGGGLYNGGVDPAVLAAVLTDDGRSSVRRSVGVLSGWPAPSADTSATTFAPSLTMLGPKFQGPRTSRLTGSLTVRPAAATTVRVSGALRRTDFLPRRADLNLASPGGTDQFGRPLYGTLVQEGGLVAALPGSNRRFGEFDVVSALTADGTSDYRSVTVSVERAATRGLSLLGSYTYSRATDDWVGAGRDLPGTFPVNAGPAAGWADGTSDFDVPHRLVLGGQLTGPRGSRLAALYRYESGRPFTPGFPEGVDANGDGVAGGDAAFVSTDVTGARALLDAWSCLRTQSGGFARRNSCRGAAASGLDARLEVSLFSVRGSDARLRVDALDLVHRGDDVPDAALYLLDGPGTLVTAGSRTTVPLVANPHFGKSLGPRGAGRTVLLGLSFNW